MSQPTPEFNDVDALLRASARSMRYPRTPNVGDRVGRLLAAEETSAAGWELSRLSALRIAAAAALAILLVVAVTLLTPQSREALADFFGLSRVDVEVGPVLGPRPPILHPDNFAAAATLAEAREVANFDLKLPAEDGQPLLPDVVYVEGGSRRAPAVIFVYEDEGFDLYQTRQAYFGKGSPGVASFHETQVGGVPALWFEEGGHIARTLDEQGRVVIESERTVERATLVWEDDGITYRLETSLPDEDAIAVAESLQ